MALYSYHNEFTTFAKNKRNLLPRLAMFSQLVFAFVITYIGFINCQSKDFRATGVTEHNNYRAKHGGPNMSGDNAIHKSAQSWADYLAKNNKFEHSPPNKRNGNGENIYKSFGSSKDLSKAVKDAVKSWYSEIKDYDFDNPGYSDATGHFTQVVWKASTKLGIGAALAKDAKYGYSITVVGQYNPAGNMQGEFETNVVRPE